MEDIVRTMFQNELNAVKPELDKVEESVLNVWSQIAKAYARDKINPESLRQESYSFDISPFTKILSKEALEAFKARIKELGFEWDKSSGVWSIKRSLIDGELNDTTAPTLGLK